MHEVFAPRTPKTAEGMRGGMGRNMLLRSAAGRRTSKSCADFDCAEQNAISTAKACEKHGIAGAKRWDERRRFRVADYAFEFV